MSTLRQESRVIPNPNTYIYKGLHLNMRSDFMKIKDLIEEVTDELTDEKADVIKEQLKNYMTEIDSCKKTLAKLEARFNKYIKQDVNDISMDDETLDY